MTVIYSEGATQAQEGEANAILNLLYTAYPGHPWGVVVMEGGFFIQYLDRPFNRPYGMFCKYNQFGYSASALKREIVMKAGEWLERAGMARGRHDADQEIVSVEGVPLKHQQREALPDGMTVTMQERDGGGVEVAP